MNRRVLTGVCTCYSVPVLNLMAQLLNRNKAVSPLSKKKRKRKNWAVNVKKTQCSMCKIVAAAKSEVSHCTQRTDDK